MLTGLGTATLQGDPGQTFQTLINFSHSDAAQDCSNSNGSAAVDRSTSLFYKTRAANLNLGSAVFYNVVISAVFLKFNTKCCCHMLRVLSPLIVGRYDLKSLPLILLVFSWSTLVDPAPDAHMVLERNFFVRYISDAVLKHLISRVSGLQELINRFASLQKLFHSIYINIQRLSCTSKNVDFTFLI